MQQNPNDVITLVIAIYGAILATLGFILSVILAIHELTKQHAKLRVKASHARIHYSDNKWSELLISIEAMNTGSGSILLTGVGWILEDGSKIQIGKPYLLDLPVKLDERGRCSAYVTCRWFRDHERNKQIVGVFYQDETGQQWKSRIPRKERLLWMKSGNDGLKIVWHKETMSYSAEDM